MAWDPLQIKVKKLSCSIISLGLGWSIIHKLRGQRLLFGLICLICDLVIHTLKSSLRGGSVVSGFSLLRPVFIRNTEGFGHWLVTMTVKRWFQEILLLWLLIIWLNWLLILFGFYDRSLIQLGIILFGKLVSLSLIHFKFSLAQGLICWIICLLKDLRA